MGVRHSPARHGVLLAGLMLLAACKVVPIAEDAAWRERRAGTFDAVRHVDAQWPRLVPELEQAAAPLPQVSEMIRADLVRAGRSNGRQAAEGSAWTFVVKGQGRVVAADRASRAGSVTLGIPSVGEVRLMTGPVLVSTALRDALPALRFDDFADQMAFAALNKALNDKALAAVRPTAEALRPGDAVGFVGVFQLRASGQPIEIVPVVLQRGRAD